MNPRKQLHATKLMRWSWSTRGRLTVVCFGPPPPQQLHKSVRDLSGKLLGGRGQYAICAPLSKHLEEAI